MTTFLEIEKKCDKITDLVCLYHLFIIKQQETENIFMKKGKKNKHEIFMKAPYSTNDPLIYVNPSGSDKCLFFSIAIKTQFFHPTVSNILIDIISLTKC